jgi:hypothetical protein
VLVPRQLQRSCRPAEVGAPRRESRARGDLQRGGPRPRNEGVKAFEADYGAKWPKAVAKITERIDVLRAFYSYPAEHWIHLRTTNPIVILSSANSVLNVRHEVSRSRVLCGGRGYLQSSRKRSLRRDDARSAGYFTGLVA